MRRRTMMAGGSTPVPNYVDTYVTPYAIWSPTKKLFSSYSGALIRVRRSSDNTEQDIGFTGSGTLDTAALLAFTGANSGYVTKIYQQAGGSVGNLAQTATGAQPRIVNAGVVETDFAQHDGVDDRLDVTLPAGGIASSIVTAFIKGKLGTVLSNGQYGAAIDTGYNFGGSGGLAVYSDSRALTDLPGVAFAMSGSSGGPYMLRSFTDATRTPRTGTHKFTARFNLTVAAVDDTALHAYLDGTDTNQGTPGTGDPAGSFAQTTLRTGGFLFTPAYVNFGMHSIVLVASDALAQRANIEALL